MLKGFYLSSIDTFYIQTSLIEQWQNPCRLGFRLTFSSDVFYGDLDSFLIDLYIKLALNIHLTLVLFFKYVLIILPNDCIGFWKSQDHNILILCNQYINPLVTKPKCLWWFWTVKSIKNWEGVCEKKSFLNFFMNSGSSKSFANMWPWGLMD